MKTEAIIITLLIANLFIIGYFYFYQYKPALNECFNDPLTYGVKQLEEINPYPIQCSCSLMSPYPAPTLYFDSEGKRFEAPIISKENKTTITVDFTGLFGK